MNGYYLQHSRNTNYQNDFKFTKKQLRSILSNLNNQSYNNNVFNINGPKVPMQSLINTNKHRFTNSTSNVFSNTNNDSYNQNGLFNLAQSMRLIRKHNNNDLLESCKETNALKDNKTFNKVPITQRIHALKQIKNNINDLLYCSFEDEKRKKLKRSASMDPCEKEFDKELGMLVKEIFYPYKNTNKRFLKEKSCNNLMLNCKGFENNSLKLIKQTPRPKMNIPVYKDM